MDERHCGLSTIFIAALLMIFIASSLRFLFQRNRFLELTLSLGGSKILALHLWYVILENFKFHFLLNVWEH
jgi:hypothetical protein